MKWNFIYSIYDENFFKYKVVLIFDNIDNIAISFFKRTNLIYYLFIIKQDFSWKDSKRYIFIHFWKNYIHLIYIILNILLNIYIHEYMYT